MSKWCRILETVLTYLRDNDWVTIEEIIEQIGLAKEKGMKILDFLSECDFIEFDTPKEKIRSTNSALQLLNMPDI